MHFQSTHRAGGETSHLVGVAPAGVGGLEGPANARSPAKIPCPFRNATLRRFLRECLHDHGRTQTPKNTAHSKRYFDFFFKKKTPNSGHPQDVSEQSSRVQASDRYNARDSSSLQIQIQNQNPHTLQLANRNSYALERSDPHILTIQTLLVCSLPPLERPWPIPRIPPSSSANQAPWKPLDTPEHGQAGRREHRCPTRKATGRPTDGGGVSHGRDRRRLHRHQSPARAVFENGTEKRRGKKHDRASRTATQGEYLGQCPSEVLRKAAEAPESDTPGTHVCTMQ